MSRTRSTIVAQGTDTLWKGEVRPSSYIVVLQSPAVSRTTLDALTAEIVACRRCPRLVAWREQAATEKRPAFADQVYWGRPVPGFGDPAARILVVGLAPAAHGGNRTGRIFTGDRSGDFLFAAVHACGLSNQPESVSADDGLRLRGLYVAAVNRCAPPANRPTPEERDNCLPFLTREIAALEHLRVILCLGSFAWDGTLRALAALGVSTPRPRPAFSHRGHVRLGRYDLLGSYHPSQQNTFTGKLTMQMLEYVLREAAALAG
jgi:uracil-DNA glycosylase family 4